MNGFNYGYRHIPNDPMQMMYQQRLQAMQQQYQQPYGSMQMPQPSGLKGRIVTGMEEARAAQIDLDGSVFVFPSLSENKIYTKSIGLDGMPVFEVYMKQAQEQKTPTYAESGVVAALQQRVEVLENMLRGVTMNVQSNAVNTDDAVGQSNGTDATAVR